MYVNGAGIGIIMEIHIQKLLRIIRLVLKKDLIVLDVEDVMLTLLSVKLVPETAGFHFMDLAV